MLNDPEVHHVSREGNGNQQAQMHEAIFGSSEAGDTANTPGVLVHFYSAQLNLLSETHFKHLLSFLQLCVDQPTSEDLFGFSLTISRIIRSLEDRQRSIDDIVGALLRMHQHHIEDVPSEVLLSSRHAIFAILGIFTMMYKLPPKPITTHFEAIVHSTGAETLQQQHTDESGRPIRALLQSAGASLPPRIADSSASAFPVSTLNFSTLALRISGRGISIVWVDDLGSHLLFNEKTRVLSLFRFPSFCARHCSQQTGVRLFDYVMDDHTVSQEASFTNNLSFHKEVLLSYRLLFGQTKAARRIFNRSEKERVAWDGFMDPLLHNLCGRKASLGSIIEPPFKELEVYQTHHFSYLHPRLNKLQDFVASRKVTRVRDKWRDRTNRSEWMAFWALLIVGILSVVTSFVQIALAAAQIQLTLHPPLSPR